MLPQNPDTKRVKGAMQDLIRRAGGIEAAAARLGMSKTHVGRWHCLDSEDMMPIWAVLALQKATGAYFVTEAMGAAQGLEFIHRPSPENSIAAAFWGVERSHADLVATAAEVFDDGAVTVAESRRLDAKTSAVVAAAKAMRSALVNMGNQAVKVFG